MCTHCNFLPHWDDPQWEQNPGVVQTVFPPGRKVALGEKEERTGIPDPPGVSSASTPPSNALDSVDLPAPRLKKLPAALAVFGAFLVGFLFFQWSHVQWETFGDRLGGHWLMVDSMSILTMAFFISFAAWSGGFRPGRPFVLGPALLFLAYLAGCLTSWNGSLAQVEDSGGGLPYSAHVFLNLHFLAVCGYLFSGLTPALCKYRGEFVLSVRIRILLAAVLVTALCLAFWI